MDKKEFDQLCAQAKDQIVSDVLAGKYSQGLGNKILSDFIDCLHKGNPTELIDLITKYKCQSALSDKKAS